MRNATSILAGAILTSLICPLQAQDRQSVEPLQLAMASPVMRLPGMRSASVGNLPGMRDLPMELIYEVSNAPNPVDTRKGGLEGQTRLSYRLAGDARVEVALFDLFGGRVRQWRFRPGEEGGREGFNFFWWDGTDEANQKVSKGGYLAQIRVETNSSTAVTIRKIGVIH